MNTWLNLIDQLAGPETRGSHFRLCRSQVPCGQMDKKNRPTWFSGFFSGANTQRCFYGTLEKLLSVFAFEMVLFVNGLHFHHWCPMAENHCLRVGQTLGQNPD